VVVVALVSVASFGLVVLAYEDGFAPLGAVLLTTLALEAAMVGAAVRLGPRGRGPATLLFGPRRLTTWPLFGWAALAFFASLLLTAIYVSLAERVSADLVPPALPLELTESGLRWLAFLIIVLAGPASEEIFFRGFLFAGLLRRFGAPVAMVISAAVFATAHLDVALLGPAFLAGIAFAYVYWRTGTLWAVIMAHTAQNAIAFAVSG
jgi:membrane protease YdiL (CAAX protease family)